MYNIPRFISPITLALLNGIQLQLNKLKNSVIIGAAKKQSLFDLLGKIISFKKSFKPSAIGCKIPQNPTTLGPRRRCIAPMTLRSVKVKIATASIIGTKVRIPIIKLSKAHILPKTQIKIKTLYSTT
jgi:hypothetical protein